MAIPYSKSIAFNWFIQLPGSYKISLFNLVEILCFSILIVTYKRRSYSKIEKNILLALILIMLSRIISLLFAVKYEPIQFLSTIRFIEVILGIILLSGLLSSKENRQAFLSGLSIGLLAECIMGVYMVVDTGGFLRGIFLGIPSYQLMVLFVLYLLLLSKQENKIILILAITVLFTGIVATQTRAALIQLIIGLAITAIIAYKQKFLKNYFTVFISAFLLHSAILYSLQSVIEAANHRYEEAIKEGKHNIEDDDSAAGGGTIQYRLYLWDKSVGAFFSHPITGIGSGSFARQIDSLPQYFGVKLDRIDKSKPLSTHNTFLGVLAETGLVGIAVYFFWLFCIIRLVIYYINKSDKSAISTAVAIMLCIFIFSDFWSQQSFLPNMTYLTAFLLGYIQNRSVKVNNMNTVKA